VENEDQEQAKKSEDYYVAAPSNYQLQQSIDPVSVAVPPNGSDGFLTWTASEFVEHQKSAKWYLYFSIGTIVASVIVYFWTKDIISTITIIVAAFMFGLFATKKPRVQTYRIDEKGFYVAGKLFPFNNFRSFAISHNGAFSSLVFIPLKRFSLLISAYYDPADEAKILDLLEPYLPLEEKRKDLIEDLMWKIRF